MVRSGVEGVDPLVVDPPFIILKGIPRKKGEDKKWFVPDDSGNPALTSGLRDFQHQLANSVKVVYGRMGAFGEGSSRASCVSCLFLRMQDSEMTSGLLFRAIWSCAGQVQGLFSCEKCGSCF